MYFQPELLLRYHAQRTNELQIEAARIKQRRDSKRRARTSGHGS